MSPLECSSAATMALPRTASTCCASCSPKGVWRCQRRELRGAAQRRMRPLLQRTSSLRRTSRHVSSASAALPGSVFGASLLGLFLGRGTPALGLLGPVEVVDPPGAFGMVRGECLGVTLGVPEGVPVGFGRGDTFLGIYIGEWLPVCGRLFESTKVDELHVTCCLTSNKQAS